MAQTPAEVLRTNLEIISRSKTIVESVQNDWRQGKISKENAQLQINNAKKQAQDATARIAAYERANRGALKNQGLTASFAAAEDQGEAAVKLSENAYKFIQYNKPDQTSLPNVKKELSVAKASIVPKVNSNKDLIQELNRLVARNASKSEIDAGLAKAKAALNSSSTLLNETIAYENKAKNAKLTDDASWAKSTTQTVNSQISDLGKLVDGLKKKTPTVSGPATGTAPGAAAPAPAPAPSPTPAPAPAPVIPPGTTNPAQPPPRNPTPYSVGTSIGLQGEEEVARVRFTEQDATNLAAQGDWRIKLSLAPGSPNILYNQNDDSVGILKPLRATDGVIFPYVPSIALSYVATYDNTALTHSNYKLVTYQGSSVEQLTITADFTAQDVFEANYLMATIHFLRSATKMFYGLDNTVKPGTPPPLCFLNGYGEFQFNQHPLVISQFSYTLPNNVNYIRSQPDIGGAPGASRYNNQIKDNIIQKALDRLGKYINQGGYSVEPDWSVLPSGSSPPTYVPTAMQLVILAYPVVSRNEVSNQFSLDQYAKGTLLQGSRRNGGGFW